MMRSLGIPFHAVVLCGYMWVHCSPELLAWWCSKGYSKHRFLLVRVERVRQIPCLRDLAANDPDRYITAITAQYEVEHLPKPKAPLKRKIINSTLLTLSLAFQRLPPKHKVDLWSVPPSPKASSLRPCHKMIKISTYQLLGHFRVTASK